MASGGEVAETRPQRKTQLIYRGFPRLSDPGFAQLFWTGCQQAESPTMTPSLNVLGDPLFAKDKNGKLKTRIGSLFPESRTLVTRPGIHATQRRDYIDLVVNRQRAERGLPSLSEEEEGPYWNAAVDLIFEDDTVQIRPDGDNMELAFRGDELLQEVLPKRNIKFLNVLDDKVWRAVKRRGECWRITALPTSSKGMQNLIRSAKTAIGEGEIYYINKATGTRYLTCHEFTKLASLDDAELRLHLLEISRYCGTRNPNGCREIDLFATDDSFSGKDLADCDFASLGYEQLVAEYAQLGRRFCRAVPLDLLHDNWEDAYWRNRMFSTLIAPKDEVVSEETLLGLSPEFFMQIRWLPGARIEKGELIFDSVLAERPWGEDDGARVDDNHGVVRGFIFNFVREYADVEYVNIGCVVAPLSRREKRSGRRGVYIVEIKRRGSDAEIVSIIRMQKWGVREHLDEDKTLINAMIQSEEYTEYILDRRLACRQVGMNLPGRIIARKIAERYRRPGSSVDGTMIWSPYFERDYVRGMATDKIPSHRFEDQAFALQFARLLGRAAAPNIIVGRFDRDLKRVLFDDGDEVAIEDERGMPVRIVVADHTGSFTSYDEKLELTAADYAGPITRRLENLADPQRFTEVYLDAFVQRFSAIQREYRRRRRAFDTLFNDRNWDTAGGFAWRWEQVLRRLEETDPREIAAIIRKVALH